MVFSQKEWLSTHKLSKATPHGPQVNTFVIVFLTSVQDHFGCTVPSGDDVFGQGEVKLFVSLNSQVVRVRVDTSSKAKIANFEVAIRVHKQVARLDVSMHDISGV